MKGVLAFAAKTLMLIGLSPMLIVLGVVEAASNAWRGERLPFDIEIHL